MIIRDDHYGSSDFCEIINQKTNPIIYEFCIKPSALEKKGMKNELFG